ncbi:hypothetical protein Pla22_12770 [Rubripirellula amarantea]|uniref:Uncharacterized protein n=1 Tax=Rubripirellula amarantea TaxID=2527999 RepID=A0A5C5WSP3_9BACT|nr:hypothetical protein Pla22_12770 [Rubripirellula amarantea]
MRQTLLDEETCHSTRLCKTSVDSSMDSGVLLQNTGLSAYGKATLLLLEDRQKLCPASPRRNKVTLKRAWKNVAIPSE